MPLSNVIFNDEKGGKYTPASKFIVLDWAPENLVGFLSRALTVSTGETPFSILHTS